MSIGIREWNNLGASNNLYPSASVVFHEASGHYEVLTKEEIVTFRDFGHYYNLSPVSGSYMTIDNIEGFSTIGFQLTVPTSGRIQFQGSFDDVNYVPITFRSVGDDGYVQITDDSNSFIGSISAVRKIRFYTYQSGFASGAVAGRMPKDVSCLESIENANPPHKIGNPIFAQSFTLTGVQTSGVILTPPSGKKYIISDLVFSARGNAGIISFFDNVDTVTTTAYKTEVTPPANQVSNIIINYSLPFVSSSNNNSLKVTTSADITIYGSVHGYFSES